MKANTVFSLILALLTLSLVTLGCNITSEPVASSSPTPTEQSLQIPVAGQLPAATVTATAQPTAIPATATVAVTHTMTPANPRGGKLIYDVASAGTAPEKRAPYGDSYDINRLERPFRQDMSYIPDLDIISFTVTKDNDWWYVSIRLAGIDPASPQDVNYGVELDLDRDGFGDYLIWAHPSYAAQWETLPVQIYQDNSHNTSGLSAAKSDAPLPSDGYEKLIFDGRTGGDDPDLAWMRVSAGTPGWVEFAFKKSWSGTVFMLGVIADAGLKDPMKLDYVDRFPIEEAGSPIKENKNYPLKELVMVDNTCREAFGFEPSNYEPQICPVIIAPTKTPGPHLDPGDPTPSGPRCQPPVTMVCPNGWDSVNCRCR